MKTHQIYENPIFFGFYLHFHEKSKLSRQILPQPNKSNKLYPNEYWRIFQNIHPCQTVNSIQINPALYIGADERIWSRRRFWVGSRGAHHREGQGHHPAPQDAHGLNFLSSSWWTPSYFGFLWYKYLKIMVATLATNFYTSEQKYDIFLTNCRYLEKETQNFF